MRGSPCKSEVSPLRICSKAPVVTSSGILGVVLGVSEKTVSIRSADTKLEILKSSVSEILEKSGDSSEA